LGKVQVAYDQFVIRISLSFGTPGLKVVTNGGMFLDVFGLYFRALFRDEDSTSEEFEILFV